MTTFQDVSILQDFTLHCELGSHKQASVGKASRIHSAFLSSAQMFGTDKSALWDVQQSTPSFTSDIHAAKPFMFYIHVLHHLWTTKLDIA